MSTSAWLLIGGAAGLAICAFFVWVGTEWDANKIVTQQITDQQALTKAVSDTIVAQQAICQKDKDKQDAILTGYENQISALNAAQLAASRVPVKCIPVTVYKQAVCGDPSTGVSDTVLQPTISNADIDNAGFAGLRCVAHVSALISATTP